MKIFVFLIIIKKTFNKQNFNFSEFRDCITKFEISLAKVPEMVVDEIFIKNKSSLNTDLEALKANSFKKLKDLDEEKTKNESTLRPNLGHPNMLPKLESLNETELKRQETNSATIKEFTGELNTKIKQNSENFLKELSKANEGLLIKFDDVLCVDDVHKHGINLIYV